MQQSLASTLFCNLSLVHLVEMEKIRYRKGGNKVNYIGRIHDEGKLSLINKIHTMFYLHLIAHHNTVFYSKTTQRQFYVPISK